MKVYEFTIKPFSAFGTPLKGDTLFGQFCWQVANDPGQAGASLPELLSDYAEDPFIVFSSAFPVLSNSGGRTYAFKTPALPLDLLFKVSEDEDRAVRERKELKNKRWMLISEGERLDGWLNREEMFVSDRELLERFLSAAPDYLKRGLSGRGAFVSTFRRAHNTINRLTGTTGTGEFAPYVLEDHFFAPGVELSLFVGIDEKRLGLDAARTYMERIGLLGFGRDASTGRGRFELTGVRVVDLVKLGCTSPDVLYTLSPTVPARGEFSEYYFTPFTRFGRHGDVLARSENPFKAPVIMADEGAVLRPRSADSFKRPFIGRAVTGISKAEPSTVCQGYSLYIPVRMES